MLQYIIPTASKYINPVLVETGTYDGAGTKAALAIGFQKVITIELEPTIYNITAKIFEKDNRVTCYCGDSAIMLWDVIKDIDQRITFWLDGHMFPGWNPKHCGLKVSPLLEEVSQISKHHIKDHVILMDDISNLCDRPEIYDLGLNRKDLEEALMQINKEYKISYFDRGGTDVLLATTY